MDRNKLTDNIRSRMSDVSFAHTRSMATMQYLYRVARIDLDEAIIRGLSLLLDYQITHKVDPDICEMCSNAFDFLLDERTRKRTGISRRRSLILNCSRMTNSIRLLP